MSVNEKMTAIADNIRAKTGGTEPLTLDGMAESIPEVYSAGQSSMVDESKLIPKTVSGSYISVDDVSEIPHSVGCKVESANLLNPDNFSGGEFVEYNGVPCYKYTDNATNFTYSGVFKENTQYTLTIRILREDSSKDINIVIAYTDGTQETGYFLPGETRVYTSSSGKTIERIQGNWNYQLNAYIDLSVSCLHEGTTALPYTPYVKPEEVSVTRTGKNLAQENDFTSNIEIGYKIYRAFTPIPANTTFTISGDFSTDSGKDMFYRIMSANGTDLKYGYIAQTELPKVTRTFTCNGEAVCMYFYSSGNAPQSVGHTLTVNNFQIELAGKATSYEPYTGQTLTPATDGTVEGMTSVSPYMNIFADTEGVNIEVEYNKSYGMQTEYDRLWDNHPIAKGAINGTNMFSGKGWNDITFKPKYDIKPTYGYMLFKGCGITDLVERLKECGVVCDLSACTNFYYAFNDSLLTHIGEIYIDKASFTTATSPTGSMFSHSYYIHTIDKVIVNDEGTTRFASDMFYRADRLANITFEGVIGNSINFQWCPLTKASITNIINTLSNTVTGQTLTLKLSAVNTAFETSSGAGDGSTSAEFAALVATKTNWTITMI